MLSSRTEMQRVIEAARNQTLAAFMQPAAVTTAPSVVPLPAIVPSVIPPSVAVSKRDDNEKQEKKERRRTRSRSRDRSERSRDKDRREKRRRDRSRSRSRDRRDRRRRDRSYSRERGRSREHSRRNSRERRRSHEKTIQTTTQMSKNVKSLDAWEQPKPETMNLNQNLLDFQSKYNLNVAMPSTVPIERNNFQTNEYQFNNRGCDNWAPGLSSRSDDVPFNQPEFNLLNPLLERFTPRFPNNPIFNNNFQENGNRPSWRNKPSHFQSQFENPQSKERETFENCCVKLQPFYGGFGEIRRFFHGLFIHNSGIKLINDKTGKRTGVIYVRFAYPEGKEEALTRSGQMIRNQPVEVTHLDDEEYDREVDRYRPPDYNDTVENEESAVETSTNYRFKNISKVFNKPSQSAVPSNYSCLIVEDLPTFVKEQDILKMFSDYSLMSIIIVGKQRKNQMAYVKFSNSDDAKQAFGETMRHKLDGKPVTIRPCSNEEFDSVNQQNEIMDPEESFEDVHTIKVESEYVSLNDLPSSINERDIRDFFSDEGIFPEKIHLINNSSGFPGQAICEFANFREAEAALAKNEMYLGSSIVMVKSISRRQFDEIMGVNASLKLPPSVNNAMANNNGPINRPQFFRHNFNVNNRGNFFAARNPPVRFPPQHTPEHLGPVGCTVLMENVPYKAGLTEILEFFSEFEIPPDNVLRRFNANGQPSGETKVIFKNPEDAQRAVQVKNREKIRDRVVYLSLC